ncbi:MAG: response regulator transcription factor [Elusimicrobiota bacterium]
MTLGKRRRILVVDDDPALRAAYREFFQEKHAEEFSASLVADAEQALSVIAAEPVDVVVLDWNLPGLPGAELAKALRSSAKTRSIGIVMITARGSSRDAVSALQAGADDYLSKPFDWDVLLARLRSLSRRSELTFGGRLTKSFPGLEFDLDADRLTLEGRHVRLAPKELELFRILVSRPGLVHSQAFLWEAVWGHESDHWAHTLKAAVSVLRQKLGRKWGDRIRSRSGLGYVFEPPA